MSDFWNVHIETKNRNKPSKDLTKLEYAAIHMHAGSLARNQKCFVSSSLDEAHALFDQLEQESSSE